MYPDQTAFEKRETFNKKRKNRELTPEEIAEQEQQYQNYNDHINDMFGVSEVRAHDFGSQDVARGLSVNAKEQLGMSSNGDTEAVAEGVAEAYGAFTQTHSADARTFSHSVEIAKQEANEALSQTSLGEVDHTDVQKRVLGEKLENSADGEEVVGKPEFLDQESQNDVANVAIAEKMIAAADEGEPEALANVQQLLSQSRTARAYFQNAKEAGGANRLDNETLAELGRNIRKYDLAVPAGEGDTAEDTPETLDDVLTQDNEQNQSEVGETTERNGEQFAAKSVTNPAETAPNAHDLLTPQNGQANEKTAAINHARNDVFAAFDTENQQRGTQNDRDLAR